MPINQDNLNHWFRYHYSDDPAVIQRYDNIRKAGFRLAEVILNNTPASADQSDAIRKVREAVMTANAAVACDGQ